MTKNKFSIKESIKRLRKETGAGIMDCRKALETVGGDINRARKILKGHYQEIAAKKVDRETMQGLVAVYVHGNGGVGAMVALLCETDFVARTKDFSDLAKELAMQVAAMEPASVTDLLGQSYIRDPKITIEELVKKVIGKTGENIRIKEIKRMEI